MFTKRKEYAGENKTSSKVYLINKAETVIFEPVAGGNDKLHTVKYAGEEWDGTGNLIELADTKDPSVSMSYQIISTVTIGNLKKLVKEIEWLKKQRTTMLKGVKK
ncbi:MAG: hypothetical protein WC976_05995 [Caldisericia bacterium]